MRLAKERQHHPTYFRQRRHGSREADVEGPQHLGLSQQSLARLGWTRTRPKFNCRITCRKNVTFFLEGSARVNSISGLTSARGTAGKPAPEPMSMTRPAVVGKSGAQARESRRPC